MPESYDLVPDITILTSKNTQLKKGLPVVSKEWMVVTEESSLHLRQKF